MNIDDSKNEQSVEVPVEGEVKIEIEELQKVSKGKLESRIEQLNVQIQSLEG